MSLSKAYLEVADHSSDRNRIFASVIEAVDFEYHPGLAGVVSHGC